MRPNLHLNTVMRSSKCFEHASKIPTLTYNRTNSVIIYVKVKYKYHIWTWNSLSIALLHLDRYIKYFTFIANVFVLFIKIVWIVNIIVWVRGAHMSKLCSLFCLCSFCVLWTMSPGSLYCPFWIVQYILQNQTLKRWRFIQFNVVSHEKCYASKHLVIFSHE
jgi:hypothetical protein